METKANARQVGGGHYKAGLQHWDLVPLLNLGYFDGQITKYLSRWPHKNGRQDLEKAVHFTDKLYELVGEGKVAPRDYPETEMAEVVVRLYCEGMGHAPGTPTAVALHRAIFWRTANDLGHLRNAITDIIAKLEASK